jgi:hypothetical protein
VASHRHSIGLSPHEGNAGIGKRVTQKKAPGDSGASSWLKSEKSDQHVAITAH